MCKLIACRICFYSFSGSKVFDTFNNRLIDLARNTATLDMIGGPLGLIKLKF